MSSRSVPFAVRALYEYEVEQEDDLPFQPGQIIQVSEICDDLWYYGYYENNGSKVEGMFPQNYVEDAPTTIKATSSAHTKSQQPATIEETPTELPKVPQPKTQVTPIEDDWGSDASADEESSIPQVAQISKKATIEPVDKPEQPEREPVTLDSTEAASPNTFSSHKGAPSADPESISKIMDELSINEGVQKPSLVADDLKEAEPNPAPEAKVDDRQVPDITPGESLSSNFKSRRGLFDQKEEERDTTKPLTKTRTNPQKLQRWQPQQEESTPVRRTTSQDEEEVTPRVSIKERLAMIQKQEQEMQQREEQERKRREQDDEALRIEEERRNRQIAREEKINAEEQETSDAEDENSVPTGPVEGHKKPPSIPVLPRVGDPDTQEHRVAGSFEDDEEGARKIALRERMARISGLGNSGGISLGMMLGRNPNNSQTGASRRPKKKDVSAMSDLERELYLASVEYDEAHGAEEEEIEPVASEQDDGIDEREIGDDETLVGVRDTDVETLAESDTEAETHRPLPVATEDPTSVPFHAPIQASPSRGPSSSIPQKAPIGAPNVSIPAPSLVDSSETTTAATDDASGLVSSSKAASVSKTPSASLTAAAQPSENSPKSTTVKTETRGAPPIPSRVPTASFEDQGNLTDTTALAADEDSSSTSSEDEYSDASGPAGISTSTPTVPVNRAGVLRQHELRARSQSDSETCYEADEDTDNPSKHIKSENEEVHIADSKRTLPPPPPLVAPGAKTAPVVPGPGQVQSNIPVATRAPPSNPTTERVSSPPPIPGQARPPPIPGKAPPVPVAAPNSPKVISLPKVGAPPVPPAHAAPGRQAPQSPPVPAATAPSPQPSRAPQVPVAPPQVPPSPTKRGPAVPPVPAAKAAPVPDTHAPAVPATPPGAAASRESHHSHQPSSSGPEVDLDLISLWFTNENGLPPSIDPTKVAAEFEHQKTNKRGRVVVNHDVYVLYSDLSQVHISISYDQAEPAKAHGSQKHIPPPRVDSSDLAKFAQTVGSKISSAASRHSDISHTSAFVKSLLREIPEALPPIKGTFGLSIYENFGGASVNQIDAIYPGDIAVLVQATFQGSKSGLPSPLSPLQKHQKTIANAVYVVQEWDGSKKKLRVYESKKESFRLGDLTSGMVRIYRPVSRDIVGW